MTNQETLDLARWAVSEARKQGANEAAVNVTSSRSVETTIRKGVIDRLQESVENNLSVSIYVDHRYSSNSTSDLRRDSLQRFLSEAVAMTRYLAQDQFRELPDPRYYAGQEKRDLQLTDPVFERTETPQRVEFAKAMEAAALEKSKQIVSVEGRYSDSLSRNVKVHSNGFEGQSEGTSFSASASVSVDDGKGGRPQDSAFATMRHRRLLPDPAAIGRDAAERALARLGQRKIASGRFDLVVENRVASRLFGALIGAMNGRALQQKSSFLDGMMDKAIASEKLTVREDPFLAAGAGSRLFDGEGMAARPRSVIDQGVLKTWYISSYYGRKMGVAPTTNGPSNLVFAAGEKDLAAIVKGVVKGVVVSNFIGGNSNSTTGDFSFGVTGQYVEDGVVKHAVNEMNVSGNFKELWKQLVELGSDPYPYGSWRIPSLRFRDVQFSGL